MATLALPALPGVPSLSSVMGAVLAVPRQVADVVNGPSLLERFETDLEDVWEPFLQDD